MILITGAAGKTGKAVIKALAARGTPVRALARRQDHARSLLALGAAEVAVGSFEDTAALARAMQDARAVYHICPNVSSDEVTFARAVAAAALAHGVERFVFHSVLHPQIEAMPHHWQKMRAEEMLLGTGFDLTILQPTAYMQNILAAWHGVVADGVFRAPYPIETRLSLADLDDVAAAAAVVLTENGHGGATYELVGTLPLDQRQVAAAIAAALGRSVRAEQEPIEAWDARARDTGMADYERVTLTAMFQHYARHGLAGNPNALRWLLGRAPTDLAGFLRRVIADQETTQAGSLEEARR
jgi:NAD(P)H dehydrogenase (quinone)